MKNFRSTTLAAAALIGTFALTSCGGNSQADAGTSGEEDVTLRFVWWGSDGRHQATQEAIEVFNESQDRITVEGEYGDWSGYWDQLATQVAGGDAPDIIQMDDKYLAEYANRDALLDLSSVDTSEFDEAVVENGRIEGGQYGITTGINSAVLVANPELFNEADVDLPDDVTWTWEDFAETAAAISANAENAFGTDQPNESASFQVWLRQRDMNFTNAQGQLGFGVEEATEYFDYWQDLVDGAMPTPSELSENQSTGPDQSLAGQGRTAMSQWWTNQLGVLSEASGAELELLRYPTQSGDATESGMWFKSSMMMSGYAGTDHPEEVATFIDWFVNSEEAGDFNGTDRGIPANASVREHVLESASEADQKVAEFIDEIEPEVEGQDVEPVPALGTSALQEIMNRYQMELFFGNMSPQQAAETMVSEMESVLG